MVEDITNLGATQQTTQEIQNLYLEVQMRYSDIYLGGLLTIQLMACSPILLPGILLITRSMEVLQIPLHTK